MTVVRRSWPARADLALAVGLCVLGLLELAASGHAAVSAVGVAAATLPVAVRRRAPLAAATAVASWPLIEDALGGGFGRASTPLLGYLVMTYTLAAHAPRGRAIAGTALLLASVELGELLFGGAHYGFIALVVAVPAVSGVAVRRYRARSRQLAALTARLERELGASARLAVAEERRRIARELHDASAHAVSRMVVQAAGAERVLPSAPERARGALLAVQETGREAIAELRHTLRILRTEDAPAPPPPAADVAAAAETAPRVIAWPAWADPLLALGLVWAVDGAVLWDGSSAAIAAAVVTGAAIVLRRRHPLGALTLAVAAEVALLATGYGDRAESPLVAILVSLYSLASAAPSRRAWVAAVVAIGIVSVALVAAGGADAVVEILFFCAAACAAGLAVRTSRRQAERLQVLAERLARERDARARLAVIDERARVARELHDSVAHAISVMVLQAGAAERVLDAAPERARAAARAIEDHGRQALGELHELLGVLGADEDAGPRAPQPSLTRLDALIDQVGRGGLPVELHVTGDPAPLPVGLDLSAYRIIQEALTNTLKHAAATHTTVTLDYTPEALTVEILDDGAGARDRPGETAGHGLIGMRERVALYRGELHAGPRPRAGYAVRAQLPLSPIGP
jgi:signal transduction histidine kinase